MSVVFDRKKRVDVTGEGKVELCIYLSRTERKFVTVKTVTPLLWRKYQKSEELKLEMAMYEQVAVPNVSPDAMKGVVSSGKTLKAIYWDLIVRCDEKFLEWKYNLELIIKCLIDGAFYYPEIAKNYIDEKLPEFNYTINIVNNYPIPEDEESEKTIDLAEVSAQTMSKKSYMRKWRNLTEEEAEAELKQLAIERQTLEESYFPTENEPLNTDML